jgi:hypothetical protein
MKIMARIYPGIRKGVNLSFCFLDKISSLRCNVHSSKIYYGQVPSQKKSHITSKFLFYLGYGNARTDFQVTYAFISSTEYAF